MKRFLSALILMVMPSVLFAQSVEREVRVETPDGVVLYGTLRLPSLESDASYPVALLIAGSGPTDRNGNSRFMVNNSIKMVAKGLCKEGIASLRYDKRGVGASYYSGLNENDVVLSTFAEDVALWVDFLSRQDNFSDITLIGHSEGALLAMMAVDKYDTAGNVDRVALLAGAGRTTDVILKEQLANQPDHIREISYEIIDSLKVGVRSERVPLMLNKLFRLPIQNFLIESMQYDPVELIGRIDVPVLIVQGTTDFQVTMEDAELLHEANDESQLVVVEQMNHVLKHCETMDHNLQMQVYSNPTIELCDGLVPALASFINE